MRRSLAWMGLGLLLVACTSDEGRCEDLCTTFNDCTALDVNACISKCLEGAEQATDACTPAFEAMSDCTSDAELDCQIAVGTIDENGERTNGACSGHLNAFLDACGQDFRRFFADVGLATSCDSAIGNTCPTAFDLVCDEPTGTGRCATGTDTFDCTCQ